MKNRKSVLSALLAFILLLVLSSLMNYVSASEVNTYFLQNINPFEIPIGLVFAFSYAAGFSVFGSILTVIALYAVVFVLLYCVISFIVRKVCK